VTGAGLSLSKERSQNGKVTLRIYIICYYWKRKTYKIAGIISPLHNGCSGTAGMGYWSKRPKKKEGRRTRKDFLVITGFYGMQTHKIIKQDACTAECMDM